MFCVCVMLTLRHSVADMPENVIARIHRSENIENIDEHTNGKYENSTHEKMNQQKTEGKRESNSSVRNRVPAEMKKNERI